MLEVFTEMLGEEALGSALGSPFGVGGALARGVAWGAGFAFGAGALVFGVGLARRAASSRLPANGPNVVSTTGRAQR